MANEDVATSRTLLTELMATAIYKRTQGRMVRQVTCGAIWLIVALGVWQFYQATLVEYEFPASWGKPLAALVRYGLPLLLVLAGGWFGYRLVNWPRFADFLISVEAEMNKVSWPSQSELFKASMVVIFTIGFLAIILFTYDFIWQSIFSWWGIS